MKVGSKVVCVNVEGLESKAKVLSMLPVVGGVYTVRAIGPQIKFRNEKPGILLDEITGDMVYITCQDGVRRIVEYHFFQYRFVEVLTREDQKAEEKQKEYAKLKICY
jgi:hypothetical protein